MTDNEIVKALECCKKDDCDNCPNDFGNCYSNLSGYALDLINRLQSENEELVRNTNKLKAENESLKRQLHNAKLHQKETHKALQDEKLLRLNEDFIKSEARKEFAERLKATGMTTSKSWDNKCVYEFDSDSIDNLLKEMESAEND